MSAGPPTAQEVLRFRGMVLWAVLLTVGVPVAMSTALWFQHARSAPQLLAPFVPFLVVGALVARSHAREVVLSAHGTVRVTTLLGRVEEAPTGAVSTRWCPILGSAGRELGIVLPEGRTVRLFMHPGRHTARVRHRLGDPAA